MADELMLGRFFGADTIARGRVYAVDERVTKVTRTAGGRQNGEVLLAQVRGSGGRSYTCLVTLGHDRAGALTSVTGSCTCPMRISCKHAVATLLVDRWRAREPELAAWERALKGFAPRRGAAAHLPVGIMIHFDVGSRRSVLEARPVTIGARGAWVKQGMTWREAGYRHHDDRGTYDPAQLALLSAMRAVADHEGYAYGRAETWLDLDDCANPRVWDLLAEAAQTGIALVRDDRDRSELTVGRERAALTLVVGRDDGLVITPTVRVGEDVLAPDSYRLVGSPPHALVHWDDDPARWQIARLDAAVSAEIDDYLERGGEPLRIPPEDEGRFISDYLPALRRRIAVRPADGVELPEDIEPSAVLTVTHLEGHRALLRWHWEGVDPEPDTRAATAFERMVLSALVVETAHAVEVGAYGLRLADERTLQGMELVGFLTHDLPRIDELDRVRVVVTGTAADYRQVADAPLVTLSSTPTDDRDWYDLAVTVSVGGEPVPFHDIFTALAHHDDHLLLPSGSYFSLDQKVFRELRELIEEARSLQDRPSQALRINRYQASLWEEFAALGVVESQAAAWREALQGLMAPTPVEVPVSVQAQLRPYQRDGFQWLCALRDAGLGGVLADDMGLGKTLQTLAMIAAARESGEMSPFLVVAPASVVGNWVAECARFTPHLRAVAVQETGGRRGHDLARLVEGADIVVTSYTLFRLEFEEYEALAWSALILDEAQFVKNRTSKTYACARLLAAPLKLAITGTPMENNLLELWALLSITAPGLFPSPERFAERYQRPIEKQHDQDRLAQLRRRIGPFLLRRTKEQVATDLPPKQEQVVELELHPRHRKVYDQHLARERQKVLGMIDDLDANRFAIFRSLTLLRRLSLSPSLVDEAYARVPSTKLDDLLPQLEEIAASGHRVLVFSQFTTFLGQVRERLDGAGLTYAYLDGRTRRRDAVIERFTSGGVPIFLISLKAGGFGLNLTAADYVFILDPWWNPATEAQAVDRTHRIGQDKPVTVYRLVAKDTIEEKVMALKASKAQLFDAVMADDAVTGRTLTADDIRALLA